MLECLCLRVYFAPVEPEHSSQEQFHKPMPTHDSTCFGHSEVAQLCPGARFVFDEAVLCQSFEHAGDGGGADFQSRGNLVGGNDAFRPAERVDRFQVVLNGRAKLSRHAACPDRGAAGPGRIAVGGSVANGGLGRSAWIAHATHRINPYTVRNPAWAETHQSVRCKSPRPSSTAFLTSTYTISRGLMYPNVIV